MLDSRAMAVPDISVSLILSTGVAAAVLLSGLAILFRRLSRPALEAFNPDLVESFSPANYRPMERLLSKEDSEFLASLPGFRPATGRALRKARRRIFRAYLVELNRDFRMLHRQARALLRDLQEDRPDLVVALLKQSFQFECRIVMAHVSLTLHWAGLEPVPAQQLVRSAEWVQEQLHSLMASPVPLGVKA